MGRRLDIRLEGGSSLIGDRNRGVSLGFFGAYAKRLRDAYRRSAQAVVSGAVQASGRLPRRAEEVDVRLVDAEAGSLGLSLVSVDEGANPELQTIGLADAALVRLMDDLDRLRRNADDESVSPWARWLVASVPEEVSQTYRHHADGKVREVKLTSGGLGEPPGEPVIAGVKRYACALRGVLISPQPSVLLDVPAVGKITIAAPETLVERAWHLRGRADLIATVVMNSAGRRLLSLRSADEAPPPTPSVEETLDRFDGVLKRLAQ